jgi:tetratricopeptide (TPR) repeat protein
MTKHPPVNSVKPGIPLYTAVIFLLLIILSAFRLQAAEPALIEGQKRLVHELYKKKMYFDCVSETRRLAAFDTDPARASDYRYFTAMNYFYGGQYLSSAAVISERGDGAAPEQRSIFLTAYSYLNLGRIDEAVNIMGSAPEYSLLPSADVYELAVRRADILLVKRDYDKASDEITRALKSARDDRLEELLLAIEARNNIFFRSPALSASMSALIPGSGQLYSGFPGAALLSILSVALPAAASWYAYGQGYNGIAAGAGFFSVLFYAGSVYGGYNSACRRNEELHNEFSAATRRGRIPDYDPSAYISTGILLK